LALKMLALNQSPTSVNIDRQCEEAVALHGESFVIFTLGKVRR